MDPRLLDYYNRELQYIREMGGEFARQFPKIAGRLGLDGFECADPYVERLLEGFAFMSARVQLKVDAEFPRFTQHLLEMVYPHYLAPTPSMIISQFQPDMAEGALADGIVVPRGSGLRSIRGMVYKTGCVYRTAHDVTLWPLELGAVEYLGSTGAVSAAGVSDVQGAKAALRLRLKTTADITFDKLALDRLPLFLRGGDELPLRVYEQVLANTIAVVVRPADRSQDWEERLDKSHVRPLGFEDEEALLPYGERSFHGYRLLHEYFAFPERYMFVELGGLGAAARRSATRELEVILLLDRADSTLEGAIDESHFALFCTPAVNLFPKRADRIHLSNEVVEHHVVPDRTRPMDFEVYEVTGAVGFGTSAEQRQDFRPFYQFRNKDGLDESAAYYTIHRAPRVLSSRQRVKGARSSYIGSEVFVSLVDPKEAPYRSDLRQLAVETLCTNRDLPLHIPIGRGTTDFTMESGAPVLAVRCLAGPTKPRPSLADRDVTWHLISHLSLNYLSLIDSDDEQGARALRDLLMVYAAAGETGTSKQIEGVVSVVSRPVNRRLPTPGPITFGRGLEITVTCEESAFEGTGIFLLGEILEQFFAKYVSINSFVETILKSLDRGEVMRWPARIGLRHML